MVKLKTEEQANYEPYTFGLEIRLKTPMLGTLPNDAQIFRLFNVNKIEDAEQRARAEQQISTLPAVIIDAAKKAGATNLQNEESEPDLSPTVFHRTLGENQRPIVYSYVLRGFMKDTCGALGRVPGTLSSGLKAYKKVIDGLVFADPDELVFDLTEVDEKSKEYERFNLRTIAVTGHTLRYFTRPLRTMTMQGERVALACSETIPPGAVLRTNIILPNKSYLPLLREWLDRGELRGLGQWRNGGFGKFTYTIKDLPFEVLDGKIYV